MIRPPRAAVWLLERRLPSRDREFLIGDLEERFVQRARARGALRARIWYWRQALAVLLNVRIGRRSGERGQVWLRGAVDDLRFAARALGARPAVHAVAALTLALGIGFSGGAFGILRGTVLSGLPFERADRLVHMERADRAAGRDSLAVTPHDYVAWRQGQGAFEDLGAYVEAVAVVGGDDSPPERLSGVFVSPEVFRLLRVAPALGRGFTDADAAGEEPIVLLAHAVWSSRLGADESIVGKAIRMNGRPHTVIGVMPAGFGFPIAEQFWMPLRIDLALIDRGEGRLDVFGRLRDGVDLEQARAEFAALGRGLAREFPETNGGIEPVLRTFEEEYIGEEFSRTVRGLLASAFFLMLVCCANVANLLLVRGAERSSELAVRSALGATGRRLTRQTLVESALLGGIGALLGVGVAIAVMRWFAVAGAQAGVLDLPHGSEALFWWTFTMDTPTLTFIAVSGLLAAVAVGLIPALRAGRGVALTLRVGGGGGTRADLGAVSRALVIAEVALAGALLVAAGVVAQSAINAQRGAPPFALSRVVTGRVSLPAEQMGGDETAYPDHESRVSFADRLLAAMHGEPSIETAAVVTIDPGRVPRSVPFAVEHGVRAETAPPEAGIGALSPGALATLGVEVDRGREFGPEDTAATEPVAIVTRTFASTYLAGREAVGSRLRLGDGDGGEPWLRVVGVVPDLWSHPRDPRRRAGILVPVAQTGLGDPTLRLGPWGLRSQRLVARLRPGTPLSPRLLRDIVYRVDSSLPVLGAGTLRDSVRATTAHYRVWGAFYAAYAVVALALGALGVGGVVSYRVAVRGREFGIRRALGATPAAIRTAVIRATLLEIGIGGVVGVVGGSWLAAGMGRLMYGVDGPRLALLASVAMVLTAAALAAAWMPARRAGRVDPVTAMRGTG